MSVSNPIVRDTRSRDIILNSDQAAGVTSIGFDFKIWDELDLKVWKKEPSSAWFSLISSYTIVLTSGVPSGGTITLTSSVPVGTVIRLRGVRLHERQTDVTRGAVIRSQSLEAELDRQAVIFQELRRDLDEVGDLSSLVADAESFALDAESSAVVADASADAAAVAAAAAAASFDNFDDRYLGAKTSDPVTDNDGAALLVGALYFNQTTGRIRVWGGVSWLDISAFSSSDITYNFGATGTVTRTIESRLRDCVSVKDFGAVMDGVTDDTGALQAALNTGRSVFIPPVGRLRASSVTVATAGQLIFGAGKNSIVQATNPAVHLFVVSSANNAAFSDLRLDGAAVDATNSTFAIYTPTDAPSTGVKVQDILFSGVSAGYGFNNAIKFDTGSDFPVVEKCTIERLQGNTSGHGYGVLLGAVKRAAVHWNVLLGAAGRGRHGVYLSAGCTHATVTMNYAEKFDLEAFTLYSTGAQPANTDNIIDCNIVKEGCTVGAYNSGGISIFGHADRNSIKNNKIIGSLGNGILINGTGYSDLKNTFIDGNEINDAAYMGIDLISAVGGSLRDNIVHESSHAAAGTYPNIRLVSDGATATSGLIITNNKSSGTTYARSAFQLNTTAPLPSNLKIDGNKFEVCNLTDIELGGVAQAIDGRIMFSTAWNPPAIANNSSYSTGFSVPGAQVGDICTASLTGYSLDGCVLDVTASAGTISVVIINASGATKDIGAGNLYVDVWKR